MSIDDIIKHAFLLKARIPSKSPYSIPEVVGRKAEIIEFLRVYSGPRTTFYIKASELQGKVDVVAESLHHIIDGFVYFLESGLSLGAPPEFTAKIEIIGCFLEQAQKLLGDNAVHPAVPTGVIGAALEEFLRTWVENEGLELDGRKVGIDGYQSILRAADMISKQDAKDIVAWGGLRNSAAHGHWEDVLDRQRIMIMLEGVALFVRKYSKS